MTEIKLTKTRRSNAIVSSFKFENIEDDDILARDSSDRNWKTRSSYGHNIGSAFRFYETRGYKWVLTDEGEYIELNRYIYDNNLFRPYRQSC